MNPKTPTRVQEINAEIARQGNKGFSVAPSAPTYVPPVTPPSTITTNDLAPVTPINIPTPSAPSTASAGDSAGITAKITNDYNSIQNELKTAQEQARQQVSESKSSLLQKLGMKSDAVTEKANAMQTPEFLAKQKAVNDAYSEVQKLDQAQRAELEALNTQGLTAQGSQSAQAGIQRKYALARANLSVVYDVANRDYQSAIENIDRSAALKQEAVQPFIDYYSQILQSDLSQFSKAEQNTLQLKLADYEKKQKDITAVGDILKTAVTNGVQLSTQDVNKINSFTNPNDALGYLASRGISLADPLERQIKQAQLNKASLEIEKLKNEADSGKPLTGEFGNIVNIASSLTASSKVKESKLAITQALSTQNYPGAYALIANNVEEALTGTNKTRFSSARTDISVMSGMRNAIQDYVDAGGDIGFLKGTADQISKKFGQLATDPKFASLAVQLDREFQAYRNEMTGAAFTPQESAEYAKVNPRSNATLDLNLATIDGAISQLANRVKSTVDTRVPGSNKIYDLAFAKSDEVNSSTPVGDVQTVNGVKYIKAQDGLYYPENQTTSKTNTSTPQYTNTNTVPSLDSFGSLFKFK